MRDFNFFEPYLSKNKKITNKKYLIPIGVFIVIIFFIIIPIVNLINIKKTEEEVVSASNIINSSKDYIKVQEVEDKSRKIQEMKHKIQMLQDLEAGMNEKDIINDFLIYTIRDMVPNDLFFKMITIDPEIVEIQGIAKNKMAIAELKYNLENVKYFQDIFIPAISGDDGSYTFTLTFTIKDVTTNDNN
ncbi:PilN domain-containing protein [Crassaminicella profunda]|uniref:PilN domain-containing protein n=1 Tax=Crassaminicella profunda TaxID=1286698 RepID=UPI001CA6C370|nr:PilN domain-containing protein [Crassaminicella profunda]QZY56979.1 PilN domain-containing protein [Crassaminicella profunda]